MKVVELLIDEDEEILENGGTAIALVNMPAHESDFFKFNKDSKLIELDDEDQKVAYKQFNEMGVDSHEFMMRGYFIKSIEEVGEYINVGMINEKFEVGVPHYTADGKLYTGPTHKDASGKLMTGAVHTEDSEYLYHEDELIQKFAESNVASSLNEKSVMDEVRDGISYKVRFKYATRPGRPAILNTSRQFCKDMIGANKIYRLEDINKINNSFSAKYGKKNASDWGNTLFKFGGPNCGHIWIRLTYQEIFKKDKKVKDQLIEAQSRDDAALIAGPNMNTRTENNPSKDTIKRAGLGQFAKEEIKFAEEQQMKQCLAGPILIPDKLIYRSDRTFGEEYYVYFSKETCERIAYKYLRDKNQSNINLEHDPNKPLEDVTLVESWIVSDPKNDKSNLYGYELPEGTWFGIVQVKDPAVFEKYVESGKTKGFSLEGFFASKLVKFQDTKYDIDGYILEEIEKLIYD
jgi:hypothetical protein